MYQNMEEDLRLVEVVPSPRQIAHQAREFYGFAHFTVNTYTGKEWGMGNEPESIFNPVKMDAEQWVKAAKDGEIKGLILTCKHHDGFCLWPSAYTEHSVKNSPYKDGSGDIVREVADACNKYGIKFGVYLSPWDRNSKLYGQGKPYDDYYVNQLTELLSNYGDVFVIWLDGACGEGENGKVQKYDWNRYYEVVRRLQPNATIFGCGPDVRWCGNEAGDTRPSEWSVVPKELADTEKVAKDSQQEDSAEFREKGLESTDLDLGSRERLKGEKDLIFYPAETDVSIRPGWFYHKEEDDKVRSLENLKEIYLRSVGGNSTLLLNMPPTPEGLFHENDVKALSELGEFIRGAFQNNLADQAVITSVPELDVKGEKAEVLRKDTYETYFRNQDGERTLKLTYDWKEPVKLTYLVVKEEIQFSQRIEDFTVYYEEESGLLKEFYKGTTVGYKKIVELEGISTKKLVIEITDSRVAPILSFVGVY